MTEYRKPVVPAIFATLGLLVLSGICVLTLVFLPQLFLAPDVSDYENLELYYQVNCDEYVLFAGNMEGDQLQNVYVFDDYGRKGLDFDLPIVVDFQHRFTLPSSCDEPRQGFYNVYWKVTGKGG